MILLLLLLSSVVRASPAPTKSRYIDQLSKIRDQEFSLEQSLMQTVRAREQAKENLKKLKVLIKLRGQEREIGEARLKELQETVQELEIRRESLNEKIAAQESQMRRFLTLIDSGTESQTDESLEAPRRKLLANLTRRGLRELETLKADLSDADQLSQRIQEEKQQLAYLFQDLNEKESVLELNRQLQVDLLKKTREDRLAQLENYRKLKTSQARVEQLIQEFNARRELEKSEEDERLANRALYASGFERLKGQLALPVPGSKVLGSFGRSFDPKSRLYIFKKGIDLQAGKDQPVRAIYGGRIAFSGELPDYGRIAIIDHGDHFYSLCAHLGKLNKKAGDTVAAGDAIGMTDDSGILYFEIRSRNVAVNPLQWVSDSFSLNR